MQLYTFYPCKADGSSLTFVVFELADDDMALVHALHVLDQHPTCSHVVAWAGERKVLTRHRANSDLRLVVSQDQPEGRAES